MIPASVITAFFPELTDQHQSELGSGLIHSTHLLTSSEGDFVFQGLNSHVFPHLDKVMENIAKVTEFLNKSQTPTLDFLKASDGAYLVTDDSGKKWRCSKMVKNTTTYDLPPTPAHLKNAARAFADFGSCLSSANLELFETISDFHHTPRRFEAMEAAWETADPERQSVADFYALRHAATSFEEYGLDGLLAPNVPQAVSHNDTKLNNCLFYEGSDKVACVIDLDTVMQGSWLMDFGDLCRTSICPAPEDTEDLDEIQIDLDRFRALVEGYGEVLGSSISKDEQERMVYSVFLLTYELALRFFTDFLQNDQYFGAKYPEHNLVRTRSQLTLALKVAAQREEMETIVNQVFS